MSPSKKEIIHWLVTQLADALGIEAGEIDPGESFASYGLSSREAVTLSGDLEEWLGRRLQPTLAWEYPTIDSLAGYLAAQPDSKEGKTISDPGTVAQEPIAIVGIGCRFPGADGPDGILALAAGWGGRHFRSTL